MQVRMEQESRWDSTGSLVLGRSLVFLKKNQEDKQIQAPSSSARHSGSSPWSSPGGKMVSFPLSLAICVFWGKDVQSENEATNKVESVLGTKGIKESWSFACTTLLGRRMHNSM